jgi:flagellar biosynthesis protein FlhB
MSEQTEQPTTQRLNKAREDGDGGVSTFASQAVAFLVAVALVPASVAALARRGGELLREAIEAVGKTPGVATFDAGKLAGDVLALTLPLLGAVALTSALASAVQAGGSFATKKLAPDLTRLDPVAGLGRLFSLDRVFSVARALAGAAFVAWVTWRTLRGAAGDLARSTGHIAPALSLAGQSALTLARDAAYVGLAVAALDILVTRRTWLGRLKMSKDEVKREHKENDGDPQVKAARERAHHEVMTSVILAKVKEASVVVVNPTHLACALRYDEANGDEAPVVLASGRGDLAAQIVQAAKAYGVPVLRDVPLARALLELEVGEEIPEALYEAVAEILRAAWEEGEGAGSPDAKGPDPR